MWIYTSYVGLWMFDLPTSFRPPDVRDTATTQAQTPQLQAPFQGTANGSVRQVKGSHCQVLVDPFRVSLERWQLPPGLYIYMFSKGSSPKNKRYSCHCYWVGGRSKGQKCLFHLVSVLFFCVWGEVFLHVNIIKFYMEIVSPIIPWYFAKW